MITKSARRSQLRAGPLRRSVGAAAVALAMVAVTGCTEPSVDLPEQAPVPPTEAAPPAVELTIEEAQAVDEVKTIVDEYLTLYVEIVTMTEPPTEEVRGELGILGWFRSGSLTRADEIVINLQNNHRLDGELRWEFVEIVEVDLDRIVELGGEDEHVPELSLRYCVDATNWTTVHKDTGEEVEPAEHRLIDRPGTQSTVIISAAYFDRLPHLPEPGPTWQLTDWEDEEEPC